MEATINRYRILMRVGRYPWKYGYEGLLNGTTYHWGDHPLESLRRLLREKGATSIIETWKHTTRGATPQEIQMPKLSEVLDAVRSRDAKILAEAKGDLQQVESTPTVKKLKKQIAKEQAKEATKLSKEAAMSTKTKKARKTEEFSNDVLDNTTIKSRKAPKSAVNAKAGKAQPKSAKREQISTRLALGTTDKLSLEQSVGRQCVHCLDEAGQKKSPAYKTAQTLFSTGKGSEDKLRALRDVLREHQPEPEVNEVEWVLVQRACRGIGMVIARQADGDDEE